MRDNKRIWILEIVILTFYKLLLEFYFLPLYFKVYGYLTDTLTFNQDKWIISNLIYLVFVVLLINRKKVYNDLYLYIIRFLYVLFVIPSLSVYVLRYTSTAYDVLVPSIYFLLTIILLKNCSYHNDERPAEIIKMPDIRYIDVIALFASVVIACFIWSYVGNPVIWDLDDTTEQRMALRASALPTILNYVFMVLGGTIFPYFFGRFLDSKDYFKSILAFAGGVLLFFTNGMKAWLFYYFLTIGIFILFKMGRGSTYKVLIMFEAMFMLLPILSGMVYSIWGNSTAISLFARITTIPANIGYKSITFFSNPDNPYLYLRESILRFFFDSPYAGGSDFYISYGANRVLESSRANNGLWGDAFRNFGIIGSFIYPIAFVKCLNIIVNNGKEQTNRLMVIVLFSLLYRAGDTSFFTWLLTGGTIILTLILKIYKSNSSTAQKLS